MLLLVGMFSASVYGGYFGAGMGVMLLAILGLALPDSIVRTSGLRTVLSLLVTGWPPPCSVHGGLAWQAVGLLAIGPFRGLGGRAWPCPSPPTPCEFVVVLIGLGTAVKLLA